MQAGDERTGPLLELEFWAARAFDLRGLAAQLSSEKATRIADALRVAGSTYEQPLHRHATSARQEQVRGWPCMMHHGTVLRGWCSKILVLDQTLKLQYQIRLGSCNRVCRACLSMQRSFLACCIRHPCRFPMVQWVGRALRGQGGAAERTGPLCRAWVLKPQTKKVAWQRACMHAGLWRRWRRPRWRRRTTCASWRPCAGSSSALPAATTSPHCRTFSRWAAPPIVACRVQHRCTLHKLNLQ